MLHYSFCGFRINTETAFLNINDTTNVYHHGGHPLPENWGNQHACLFIQTLALYKSLTYLLTYNTNKMQITPAVV